MEDPTIFAAYIAAIMSGISLIVTALGWIFTYSSQQDLKRLQHELDKELHKDDVLFPRRIKILDEILDWYETFGNNYKNIIDLALNVDYSPAIVNTEMGPYKK